MDFQKIYPANGQKWSENSLAFCCDIPYNIDKGQERSEKKAETEGGVHMKMSDVIADFIGEMLSSGGGVAEVQRKSLADRFSCVPSQINYVIETRFTPEHGYLVESQRGGGGYIRIVRLMDDKQRTLLEAARGIGGRLTQNDAARLTRALLSAELLTQREAQLLLSACSDGALAEVDKTDRDRLRAAIFRCAVMGIATA